MPTGAAAAKFKLKKVSVGLSDAHRKANPVVHVNFYDGKWRILSDKKIHFDLRVFARANVGTAINNIYVTAPADGGFDVNRWRAKSNSTSTRRIKANHSHHSMKQRYLGNFGRKVVDFCKQQMPGGVGQ
ncbi:MAG: hypothetical protein O7I42_14465, partial [Alphaproteobacteria bacterium]|nr:hypothetical protein [Alphaproteobacteria bacterium]